MIVRSIDSQEKLVIDFIEVFKRNIFKEDLLDQLKDKDSTARVCVRKSSKNNNTYCKLRAELVKRDIYVPETNVAGPLISGGCISIVGKGQNSMEMSTKQDKNRPLLNR